MFKSELQKLEDKRIRDVLKRKVNWIEPLFLIKINYKSGNSVVGWFTEFQIKSAGAGATSISWTSWSSDSGKPIYLNVSDIESVEQITAVEPIWYVRLFNRCMDLFS